VQCKVAASQRARMLVLSLINSAPGHAWVFKSHSMMSHRCNESSFVNSNSNGQATRGELEYACEAFVLVFRSFSFDDATSLLIAPKEKREGHPERI
jgi:hypothetical protein